MIRKNEKRYKNIFIEKKTFDERDKNETSTYKSVFFDINDTQRVKCFLVKKKFVSCRKFCLLLIKLNIYRSILLR